MGRTDRRHRVRQARRQHVAVGGAHRLHRGDAELLRRADDADRDLTRLAMKMRRMRMHLSASRS